jgi:hypothetical protein
MDPEFKSVPGVPDPEPELWNRGLRVNRKTTFSSGTHQNIPQKIAVIIKWNSPSIYVTQFMPVSSRVVTAAYIHLKAYLNNEGKLELNQYTKPAVFVAILVYVIILNGIGQREVISNEPF